MRRIILLALAVLGFGLLDLPLGRGLPRGDDTAIHLYRLVDLARLLREGVLYSRWQPDLVYGYGAPLFSFYAPLSAYLAVTGHLLGLSLRDGLRLELAILPPLAGIGTYLFLRRRLGEGPALLGALAYPASLYFLYNLYVRGSVSDALAMALFPLALLALDALASHPGPARAALLALAYAAVLLGHDISGPLILPLLILAGLWWSAGDRRALAWSAAGLGLGIALTLFFLGPAALDASQTRVPEFLAAPGMRFDQHFIGLGDVFVPFAVAYPGAMLTGLPLGVGLVQAALALAAVVAAPRLAPRLRGEVAILAFLFVACVILTVPVSTPLWARLPVLPLVQYPWRLLALAAFAGALLIGYGAEAWLGGRSAPRRALGLGLVALLLLILAVPYLYPLPGDDLPANPDLGALTAFQQRTGALGSTSNAEFLPAGLAAFPPGPPLPGADQGATLAQKLDPASLPSGATVQAIAADPLSATLRVDSPVPVVAHFFVFRFPGWAATLDGQAVPLAASGPFQTLRVAVPAGAHTLAVSFGETPTRRAFDLASALALLVVLGLLVVGVVAALPHPLSPSPTASARGDVETPRPPRQQCWRGARGEALALLLAVVLVLGLKPVAFNRGRTPLVRPFDGAHPPGMTAADPHRFGPSLHLLGYSLTPETPRPGGPITVDLYWQAASPLSVQYSSFVHLMTLDGRMVAQNDNAHVGDLPTTDWQPGAYARDIHRIEVPASLPPGIYRIDVGVYDANKVADPTTGGRLLVDGQAAQAGGVGTYLTLRSVEVKVP